MTLKLAFVGRFFLCVKTLALLILCTFFSNFLSAQNKNFIKVRAIVLPLKYSTYSSVGLGYERALSSKWSLQLLANRFTDNSKGDTTSTLKTTWNIVPEVRYNLAVKQSTKRTTALYLGVYSEIAKVKSSSESNSNTVLTNSFRPSLGGLVGAKILFKNNFFIEFYTGYKFDYYFNKTTTKSILQSGLIEISNDSESYGLNWRKGLNIGFSF